jgi:hypothetical protein
VVVMTFRYLGRPVFFSKYVSGCYSDWWGPR